MAPHPEKLIIATRESRLALWQAEHVRARLQALYPRCDVQLLGMTTRGDQILDRALSQVGGKGLFVKELETAMLDGRADLAVHSLKDMPMEVPAGLQLTAVLERADPRDAFVSAQFADLDALPAGAVVGTSSLRRQAALTAAYPHLVIKPLRGNLDTRLRKLDAGEYAAIICTPNSFIARPTCVRRCLSTFSPSFTVTKKWLPRSLYNAQNSPQVSITSRNPAITVRVDSSSTSWA